MRALVVCLIVLACGATAAPQYSSELIFPLEKWHNHSSSIVELPNGDLLVCWFHGSGERTADHDHVIKFAVFGLHGTQAAGSWKSSLGTRAKRFCNAQTP